MCRRHYGTLSDGCERGLITRKSFRLHVVCHRTARRKRTLLLLSFQLLPARDNNSKRSIFKGSVYRFLVVTEWLSAEALCCLDEVSEAFLLDLSSYFHSFFSPFFSSFIFLSEFPRHATPTPAAEIYVTRHNLQNFSLFFGMWFHFHDPHDNCRRLFHLLPSDNQVTPGPVWRPSERWMLLMSESLLRRGQTPSSRL